MAGTHIPFRQHPFGHEAARQTHCPSMQRVPSPHIGPVPHAHWPVGEHRSARRVSHPAHVPLPVPQVLTDGMLHILPEQQPSLHVEMLHPLQRPSAQDSPAGHTSQLLPPAPHESGVSPGKQRPPEQQPSLHDVPSHTQVPLRQRWPGKHTGPSPQRQVPAAEQLSARMSHAVHVEPRLPQVVSERVLQTTSSQQPLGQDLSLQTHCPPSQACPPAHGFPVPQAHAPVASHRSAFVGSHATHLAASRPHDFSDVGLTHTLPSQHPVSQFFSSQTHAPFMHT